MAADEQQAAKGTEYIVLALTSDNGPNEWQEIGKGVAVSAESAVRRIAESRDIGGGTYVAVPARSWKPVTVTVETKREVRLG